MTPVEASIGPEADWMPLGAVVEDTAAATMDTTYNRVQGALPPLLAQLSSPGHHVNRATAPPHSTLVALHIRSARAWTDRPVCWGSMERRLLCPLPFLPHPLRATPQATPKCSASHFLSQGFQRALLADQSHCCMQSEEQYRRCSQIHS